MEIAGFGEVISDIFFRGAMQVRWHDVVGER